MFAEWTVQHRAFAVEAFFKNESMITTQRLFHNNSLIHRNDVVSHGTTIKCWVNNFRNSASALKIEPTGRSKSIRTPENLENVRASVLKSHLMFYATSTRKLNSFNYFYLQKSSIN
jgi:hypothetical protein